MVVAAKWCSRSFVARPNAIAPIIGVGETTARPAHHRSLELLHVADDVLADSAHVGDSRVLAHSGAIADHASKVLDAVAVNLEKLPAYSPVMRLITSETTVYTAAGMIARD